jgi:hypothetical protein
MTLAALRMLCVGLVTWTSRLIASLTFITEPPLGLLMRLLALHGRWPPGTNEHAAESLRE